MRTPLARVALYGATTAAALLAARSLVLGPPPLALSVGAAVGYGGLILSGVFSLRLRMFADALTEGPKGARGVALTFDDGPDPQSTPAVLRILDQAGVKAAFFVIGRKAALRPDLVREIAARGHAVGVHGHRHDRLFALRRESRVRADLEEAVATLEGILGERPRLFRPPIGHTNPTIARVADDLDLLTVGWSLSGHDGVGGARPGDVAARVRRDLRDGAIVLLHDGAEREDHAPAAVEALPAILDAIAAQNLEVVDLRGWVAPAESGA